MVASNENGTSALSKVGRPFQNKKLSDWNINNDQVNTTTSEETN